MKARILLTLDGSESSTRAAEYVANLLGGQPDVSVTLFHILLPIPPSLLEAGSFEAETQLELQRADWVKNEQVAECQIFGPMRELLEKAGFDGTRIQTKCPRLLAQWDVAQEILRESEKGCYDTIVIGRRGRSRIATFLTGSVTDKVVRHARVRAVWVVE